MSENEIVDNTETNVDINPIEALEKEQIQNEETKNTVLDGSAGIENIPGGIPNIVTKEEKPLNTTNPEEAKAATSDLEIFGNPDCWVLLSKASSKAGNWMKSTKAMFVDNGCILQVTTQLGEDTSEALTYVPGVQIGKVGGFPALVKL